MKEVREAWGVNCVGMEKPPRRVGLEAVLHRRHMVGWSCSTVRSYGPPCHTAMTDVLHEKTPRRARVSREPEVRTIVPNYGSASIT
jgi:hypothetical protein